MFDRFGKTTGYGQYAPGRDLPVDDPEGQPGRPRKQPQADIASAVMGGIPVGGVAPFQGAKQTTQPEARFDPTQRSPNTGINGPAPSAIDQLSGVAGAPPSQAAASAPPPALGTDAWIGSMLQKYNSTDDPGYWKGVINKSYAQHGTPEQDAAFWEDRIMRGDGAADVKSGKVSKFQDNKGNSPFLGGIPNFGQAILGPQPNAIPQDYATRLREQIFQALQGNVQKQA